MSEFSESNDTSTEALDSASEGTSLSDTLEWTDASPEVSDSGVFSIAETDDFTIIDTDEPSLEPPEVKEATELRDEAIDRILEDDSTYMPPDSLARMEGRKESVSIVPYNGDGIYGTHHFENGETTIELVRGTPEMMRVTALHEHEHMASYHSEVAEKHHNSTLYTVLVGLRDKEYIVDRDGEYLVCRDFCKNLNEGITQYLTEDKLSVEDLSMARAMGVYPFATETAASLSEILGRDAVREDFYGGSANIRNAMESLAPGTYSKFAECLDKASESPDVAARREAMQEANKILNKLAERKAAENQHMEA
jgi:hypothetical protein